MKNGVTIAVALLCIVLLGAGCSKKTTITDTQGGESVSVSDKKLRRYDVQDATITYDVHGTISGTEKLSIKNYGLQEARETHTSVTIAGFTQKTDTLVLTDGVNITSVDLNALTATTMQNPLYDQILKNSEKDLKEVGEAFMKNMNAKKTGTDTVAGKECDVWTLADLSSEVCVWKGIPLRSSSNVAGVTYTQTATSIAEHVDNNAFDIPNGVTVRELPVDLGDILNDL